MTRIYQFGTYEITEEVHLKRPGEKSVYDRMEIDEIKERIFEQKKLGEF